MSEPYISEEELAEERRAAERHRLWQMRRWEEEQARRRQDDERRKKIDEEAERFKYSIENRKEISANGERIVLWSSIVSFIIIIILSLTKTSFYSDFHFSNILILILSLVFSIVFILFLYIIPFIFLFHSLIEFFKNYNNRLDYIVIEKRVFWGMIGCIILLIIGIGMFSFAFPNILNDFF